MSKGLIIGLVIIVVFGAFVALDTMGKNKDLQKIKENPKQTICKVTGHGIPKKSSDTHYGVWVEYEYTVNGEKYNHQRKYYFPKNDEHYFGGQSFPLIYCATDPDINRILIINTNFEDLGLSQPDSLKQYNHKIY